MKEKQKKFRLSDYIKDLRREYREKEAHESTIELLYITRAIRKGNTRYGTN